MKTPSKKRVTTAGNHERVATKALLVIAIAASGCGSAVSTCRTVGICDAPAPATVDAVLLLDSSMRSSGTSETLAVTTERVARTIAHRPGSRLSVWWLGPSLETTRPLAPEIVVPNTAGSEKRAAAERERFVRDAVALIRTAAQLRFAEAPPMRSPIAAGLTQVAQSFRAGLDERLVVVVSDLRETVVAPLECGALPSLERWRELLAKEGALPANSFSRTAVIFAYALQPSIPGCPVDLNRQLRLRQLWTAALKSAGATTVDFEIGAPNFPPASEQ